MLIYSIVVTFNGIKWIDKCISSLINSSASTRILVIDNKSTDGTLDHVRSNFPTVEIIENKFNIGFGEANNIGLFRALSEHADFAFLLNQDAWVEFDTIEKLVSAHSSGYAVLSPIHMNGQGYALDSNFSTYLLNSLTPSFLSDIMMNKLKSCYDIQFVNAAAWLLNMKCVERVGGFDPEFFMYGEDDNYILRFRYHGYKVGVCPSSIIYHDRDLRDPQREKIAFDIRHRETNSVMVKFKDINNSLFGLYINTVFSRCYSIFKDLFRGRFRSSATNTNVLAKVIFRLPDIVRSRRQAKTKCAFINL